jgi:hypothetical protein
MFPTRMKKHSGQEGYPIFSGSDVCRDQRPAGDESITSRQLEKENDKVHHDYEQSCYWEVHRPAISI